jgi:transposase
MSIVGGFDIHRKQITFDYLDTVTGEVECGQIAAADRSSPVGWCTSSRDSSLSG